MGPAGAEAKEKGANMLLAIQSFHAYQSFVW